MDEREHERFIIDREVECFVGERRYEVFVYDLSAGGCMIEAPHLELEGGTLIHLRLNHFIEAQGKIVWLAKGRHLKVCAPDNDLADIMRTSAN